MTSTPSLRPPAAVRKNAPQAQSVRPGPNLALALATRLAAHFTDGSFLPDAHLSHDEERQTLEDSLGRSLTPAQARLLAAREGERTDLRALAERLPEQAATTATSSGRRRQRSLTRADLGMLPLTLWQQSVEWLLGAEGYILTRMASDAFGSAVSVVLPGAVERLFWQGERDGASSQVVAVRLREATVLGADDLHAAVAAARSAGEADGARPVLVITPAIPTVGARLAAQSQNLALLGGAEVDALLARLAVEYAEEQARESESIEERATAAAKARTAILKHLADLLTATERAREGAKKGTARSKARRTTADSRATIAEAVATIAPHTRALAQIGMAWDTLADEWSAAFGTHAERAGTLPVLREAPDFRDLAERAGHLRAVALPALIGIGATPPAGELGYGAWRISLCEVLSAHFRALEARIAAISPAEWRDFPHARDAELEAEASRLHTEYSHAAARLQKTRADLASRAALDVPDL